MNLSLIIFVLLILVFIFSIGLCIGSFLNVVILRAFSNESIILPRSKCPKCQAQLEWFHNIPILSYFVLKGKCAFCNDEISIQYPIIELITGVLFVAVFLRFGISWNALFLLAIVSFFVVLAATDIKEKVVFDAHTYGLVGTGLVYNLFNLGNLYPGHQVVHIFNYYFGINNSLISAVLGILLGIVVMEIFARFGYLVAGTRAFGEGDTYIAAGLGAVFGWQYLIVVLALGFIIQILITIPVFIKKLYIQKDYKTLVSFFVFFLALIVMKSLEYSNILIGIWGATILTLILCAIGFYVCKRILGGLKDQSNMTYLPFGPAMVVGGLIAIFLFCQVSAV